MAHHMQTPWMIKISVYVNQETKRTPKAAMPNIGVSSLVDSAWFTVRKNDNTAIIL